jgi:hypothetical protein
VFRRIALLIAVLVAAVGVSGAAARPTGKTVDETTASKSFMLGLYDEAQTLYGNPDTSFPLLKQLKVKILRTNLYWGHPEFGVARRKPANAADPDDPAYDWDPYDRVVKYANANKIKIIFSIWGTPKWANGGRAPNRAPTKAADLQKFAAAAAKRYNGKAFDAEGNTLARVSYWLAWNEPNLPIFLFPQYVKVAGGWRIESARQYAKICNAIYAGVKSAQSTAKIGCGVTSPRGNNNPNTPRPSTSPLAFLRAAKAAGMKRFDAYAHHPYYGKASEEPGKAPPRAKSGAGSTAVTLGNLGDLIKEVTRLYGAKRIWLTEYGYQTNPPDRLFGVTYAQQASYLKQAVAIAKANPRVDMLLWFLLRDEPIIEGWQSGLMTARGVKKPAFNAFRAVAG